MTNLQESLKSLIEEGNKIAYVGDGAESWLRSYFAKNLNKQCDCIVMTTEEQLKEVLDSEVHKNIILEGSVKSKSHYFPVAVFINDGSVIGISKKLKNRRCCP